MKDANKTVWSFVLKAIVAVATALLGIVGGAQIGAKLF